MTKLHTPRRKLSRVFRAESAEPLAEVLKHGTPRQREYAYTALGDMGPYAGDALDAMKERLWRGADTAEAQRCLWRLYEIAERGGRFNSVEHRAVSARAGRLVQEATSHPNEEIRRLARRISARLKQPEALAVVLKALREEEDKPKKIEALEALQHLAAVEETSLASVQAALPFMDGGDPELMKAAAGVLASAKGDEARHAAIDALMLKLKAQDDPTHASERMRFLVVAALGQLGDKRAVEPLVAAVKDERWRSVAASILAKLGDPRGGEALLEILEQRRGDLLRVIGALGDMGYERAIQPLIGYIAVRRDGETYYGPNAAGAIVAIGKAATPHVLAVARDQRNPARLRLTMLSVLERLRDPSSAADLVMLLDDPNKEIVAAAATALQPLAHRPYGTNVERWKQWWAEHADEFKKEGRKGIIHK